ncbi:RagB/SusD family nutrient uptake outer membrane protein [Persicobacter psychrovividus]|uniref:Membrane protein n=1 Tax=Persicobacter psychrovividus TaxID=387638 RepID=A0ABN6LH31_9BACT|nr:membrane protein [Persicobacter psychrovividus]
MTKYKNIFTCGLLLLMMSMSGCADFLDLSPTDSQTEDSFYQNRDEAFRALMGVYEPLRSQRLDGNHYNIGNLIFDSQSDDAYVGAKDAADRGYMKALVRFGDSRFGDPSASNVLALNFWTKNYGGISRANVLLERYDQIEFKDREREDKENFYGETLFLRAHYYYELLRVYENIPLILTQPRGDEWKEIEQATPAQAYAQVTSDMLQAIDMMAPTMGGGNLGRLTQWAAKAELLKMYMFYTGYYQSAELPTLEGPAFTKADAIALAEDIINNSGARLEPEFKDIFTEKGNFGMETLFEIPFSDTGISGAWRDDALGNFLCTMAGPRDFTASQNVIRDGWGHNIPSHELVDLFTADDKRSSATFITADSLINEAVASGSSISPRNMMSVGYNNTGYFSFKYTSHYEFQTDVDHRFNYAQNIHYIRFADVLLMAAELNLDANSAKSVQYVNMVRNRAGLDNLTSVDLDAIYLERRKELAMEGHRYFDVLRRGLDYADQQLTVTSYTLREPSMAGVPSTGDGGIADDFLVTFDQSKRGFWPIPQQERDLNPKLNQNPGW